MASRHQILLGSSPNDLKKVISGRTSIPQSSPVRHFVNDRLRMPQGHQGAAMRAGTEVIVMDSRRSELARTAYRFLQFKPDTDVALLNAMMHVIIEENLVDAKFIADRSLEPIVLRQITPQSDLSEH